ncbi:MAG: TIGR02647 family protein, partial [Pseudomonadota bacterium]|nr:TIGR02647 family protein [Pseudomonadota bacterium]
MTIKQALIDELEVLLQFPLDSTQAGIKIHQTAKEGLIEAAQQLYDKGMI